MGRRVSPSHQLLIHWKVHAWGQYMSHSHTNHQLSTCMPCISLIGRHMSLSHQLVYWKVHACPKTKLTGGKYMFQSHQSSEKYMHIPQFIDGERCMSLFHLLFIYWKVHACPKLNGQQGVHVPVPLPPIIDQLTAHACPTLLSQGNACHCLTSYSFTGKYMHAQNQTVRGQYMSQSTVKYMHIPQFTDGERCMSLFHQLFTGKYMHVPN